MPNMDGFELYDKIRKVDNKVKACFITAYRLYTEALVEIYHDSEVGCFLEKPIGNEELLTKVVLITRKTSLSIRQKIQTPLMAHGSLLEEKIRP